MNTGVVEKIPRKPRAFVSGWQLKATMAITGLIWILFVLIHLFGNLKVFAGPESFNNYAAWLRTAFYPFLPPGFVLWLLRIVLIVALLAHVGAAGYLWLRGRAGGSPGARKSWRERSLRGHGTLASVSAALMPFTGVVILIFLVVHVLDLTVGAVPVASPGFQAALPGTSDAYANLVASLSRPWAAGLYLVTMVLLSIHVLHGVQSAGNDLGALAYRLRLVIVWVAGLAALAILLGNGAIPVAVQIGALQ